MARPRMLVVAGPPGSGKTTFFPVTAVGVDSFNIDDRCAQILGSYRAISRDVRRAVARECERFVREHIDGGRGFAVETTLRTRVPIEQAELARKLGFATHLRFIATDSVAVNVSRVLAGPCLRFHGTVGRAATCRYFPRRAGHAPWGQSYVARACAFSERPVIAGPLRSITARVRPVDLQRAVAACATNQA